MLPFQSPQPLVAVSLKAVAIASAPIDSPSTSGRRPAAPSHAMRCPPPHRPRRRNLVAGCRAGAHGAVLECALGTAVPTRALHTEVRRKQGNEAPKHRWRRSYLFSLMPNSRSTRAQLPKVSSLTSFCKSWQKAHKLRGRVRVGAAALAPALCLSAWGGMPQSLAHSYGRGPSLTLPTYGGVPPLEPRP